MQIFLFLVIFPKASAKEKRKTRRSIYTEDEGGQGDALILSLTDWLLS